MIVIDLSKKQAVDADPKAMQQHKFTGILCGAYNRVMFFIT